MAAVTIYNHELKFSWEIYNHDRWEFYLLWQRKWIILFDFKHRVNNFHWKNKLGNQSIGFSGRFCWRYWIYIPRLVNIILKTHFKDSRTNTGKWRLLEKGPLGKHGRWYWVGWKIWSCLATDQSKAESQTNHTSWLKGGA